MNRIDAVLDNVAALTDLWLDDWSKCDWTDGERELKAKILSLRETLDAAAKELDELAREDAFEVEAAKVAQDEATDMARMRAKEAR